MGRLIDLTGQRFGKLVVIRKSEQKNNSSNKSVLWLCRCDCGNEKIINGFYLRTGDTKSCGCLVLEVKDLIGMKFGRWKVIDRGNPGKSGQVTWLCECDCGVTRDVIASTLINGTSTSCGCFHKELMKNNNWLPKNSLPKGRAAFNRLYGRYKRDAEIRGYTFELSGNDFYKLTNQNCFYCGIEPFQKIKHENENGDYIYNGIDRIDSSKGYIEGNVVPCCGTCNKAKLDTDKEDFKFWIERVYNHWIKGENNVRS